MPMNQLKRSYILFRKQSVLSLRTCRIGSMNSIYPFLFVNKNACVILQSLPSSGARLFCSNDDKKNNEKLVKDRKLMKKVKTYLEENKSKLSGTELRVREKAHIIVEDIKATKKKVQESVENIIEKENIYTIPNLLCVLRIGLCPWLGILIMNYEYNFALGILGFAAVTDLLDGWIARTWESQSSKVGSFLDPVADKVLIATLFLSLTYTNLIPIALTSIIIGRDVILIIAGIIIRYRSLPPPRTLSKYFDVSYATVQLAPTFISKVNTTIQLILVGSTLAAPVFQYVGHPLLECLWYITGVSTVAAGLSYVVSKNTYKYLGKNGN